MDPVDSSRGTSAETVVVHVSDLHFGKHFQPVLAEELAKCITRWRPKALVVAGDVTMRARAGQFRQAREFLRRIPAPKLVVPGNHDVPLYNLPARALFPFRNYNRFIADLVENPITLAGVTLLGINTVNPWMHQRGRITPAHLERIREWCRSAPRDAWRVLVIHQHLFQAPVRRRPGRIREGEALVRTLGSMGVDALVAGHLHFPYVVPAHAHVPDLGPSVALVHSGTPTSRRTRSQSESANSFNVIEFTPAAMTVTPHNWNPGPGCFQAADPVVFERSTADRLSAAQSC